MGLFRTALSLIVVLSLASVGAACGSNEETVVSGKPGRNGTTSKGGSSGAGSAKGGSDGGSGTKGGGATNGKGGSAAGGGTSGAGASAATGGSAGKGLDLGGSGKGSGGAPAPSICEADTSCDDGNACTTGTCKLDGGEIVTGACLYAPAPDGTPCADDDPCTKDACAAGSCKHTPATDGTACTLGSGTAGVCKAAACETPCATGCDDGNPCTTDSCLPSGSCGHAPAADGTACDDGKVCSSGDACKAGKCTPTEANTCLPPPVDIACPVGCAVGEAPLSAAPPLEPPALPATCSGGFEVNKPKKGSVYTITSKTPGGSSAAPLDVQIATYTAPDHMVIRATRKNGTTYPVVDTCTLKTALYSDPTGKGCVRPPEDSIRQYKVKLEAGTTKLEFDFAGACTPTYLRVLGLCEFEVTPFVPDCSFRTIE